MLRQPDRSYYTTDAFICVHLVSTVQPHVTHRSLLSGRGNERKDTRVFAHATAETQVAITDTMATGPLSKSQAPVLNTQEAGFLEVRAVVHYRGHPLLLSAHGRH